jgi:hypothetical protein
LIGNITLKLCDPKTHYSWEDRGSIDIHISEETTVSVSGPAITEARNAAKSSGVEVGGTFEFDTNNLSVATSPAISFANIISKLAMLDKICQTISKVSKSKV